MATPKYVVQMFVDRVRSQGTGAGSMTGIGEGILADIAEKVLLSPEVSDTYPDPATGERLPRFTKTEAVDEKPPFETWRGVKFSEIEDALRVVVEAYTVVSDEGLYFNGDYQQVSVTSRLAAWRKLRMALGLPV